MKDGDGAPANPASVTRLRRLGLNCDYCGHGRTALCYRHLPPGWTPEDVA